MKGLTLTGSFCWSGTQASLTSNNACSPIPDQATSIVCSFQKNLRVFVVWAFLYSVSAAIFFWWQWKLLARSLIVSATLLEIRFWSSCLFATTTDCTKLSKPFFECFQRNGPLFLATNTQFQEKWRESSVLLLVTWCSKTNSRVWEIIPVHSADLSIRLPISCR